MMSFSSWERRVGWLAFPGLLRHLALLHVLVFVIQIFRPDIGEVFDFDRTKILSGEAWRLITGFFAFSNFGGPTPLNILLLVCAVRFAFMVNDGLEMEWGAFKTSLFCYAGMLGILAAQFILRDPPSMTGFALQASAFLAFATIYPKVEILLMLIIPVRVAILAVVQGVLMLVMCVSEPMWVPFFLLGFANYFLWAGIPALRGGARLAASAQRRKRFQNAAKLPAGEAFHTCVGCERTDASHPSLEFRVGGDGREYCVDHLPES
jgi:hypothetical protein